MTDKNITLTDAQRQVDERALNLDKLQALAESVPEHIQLKGWFVEKPQFGHQHVYADDFKGHGRQHIATLPADKNYFGSMAEFIATFNPATVRTLIAQARGARLAAPEAPTALAARLQQTADEQIDAVLSGAIAHARTLLAAPEAPAPRM